MRRKVEHYLKAGVEIVWVVDPVTKTVTIHAPKHEPIELAADKTLEIPNLIPRFSLLIADVFRE
jgi:Uma2 family endonuclease